MAEPGVPELGAEYSAFRTALRSVDDASQTLWRNNKTLLYQRRQLFIHAHWSNINESAVTLLVFD